MKVVQILTLWRDLNMKIVWAAQYEGEAACQGANPARGGARRRNFDWIFCARERCGSPTGVTAHSSSATAGANQDHRAGAHQDHNPERLWRQRGVVGASPQERDGGVSRCGLPACCCAVCAVLVFSAVCSNSACMFPRYRLYYSIPTSSTDPL